jgi:hypothetical protein
MPVSSLMNGGTRTVKHDPIQATVRQGGLTLMEVLIAVLVLSLGLVAMAGLHQFGLRNAHSAYYTSIAATAALDLEERLWHAASTLDEGCLSRPQHVEPLLAELVQRWSSTDPDRIGIPGLDIDLISVESSALDPGSGQSYWTEVRVAVTWQDGRMATTEVFPYTVRVVCAPGLPPEQENES